MAGSCSTRVRNFASASCRASLPTWGAERPFIVRNFRIGSTAGTTATSLPASRSMSTVQGRQRMRRTRHEVVVNQLLGRAGRPGPWGGEAPCEAPSPPAAPPYCPKLVPRSRCPVVVVAQQPAQPVATANSGATERTGRRRNQVVAEALMVPLRMVVRHEFLEHVQQAPFAEENQVVQALLANRA